MHRVGEAVRPQLGHLAAVALGELGRPVARLDEQLLHAGGALRLHQRLEVPGGVLEGGIHCRAHNGETRGAWPLPSRRLRPRSPRAGACCSSARTPTSSGAFKWRGALPSLERYRDAGASAVVTASTGNHGAATAWAAQRTGLRAIVYVPDAVSAAKLELLEGSAPRCATRAPTWTRPRTPRAPRPQRDGLPFFEDGAEPAQFEGYAAIGREIVEQLGEAPALTSCRSATARC